MLGFSQYSQVSYVAIIEQKMRVFFLSTFVLSPRLAGLLQGAFNASGTLQSAVLDSLFELFVQSLKEKNIYEEYLVPSVFINNINYSHHLPLLYNRLFIVVFIGFLTCLLNCCILVCT